MSKAVLFLVFLCLFSSVRAQDPEFSQFFAAPLHLNPALAGISYGPRVTLNYRNQWPAIEKGFVTYAASYDMHVDALRGGIGVIFMGDRIANGLLNTYTVNLMYSYQLKLSRKFGIKLGVMGGYTHRSVDWYRLSFSDMIDPVYGFVDEFDIPNPTAEPAPGEFTMNYGDVGAGAIAFSSKFFGGLSVKHLIRPRDSFSNKDVKLPIRIAVHAGGEIDLVPKSRKRDVFLAPNFLLAQQSNFLQLNVGTYVNVGKVYGGAWFRHTFRNSDAVIGLLGLKISYIRIAYSYDYTISKLRTASGGAHEVSFTFNLGGDDNSLNPKKKRGALECPRVLNF